MWLPNPGDFSFHITITQQTSPKHKLQKQTRVECCKIHQTPIVISP